MSLLESKSPKANLIAKITSLVLTDYIPWFNIQFQCSLEGRDTLCPF